MDRIQELIFGARDSVTASQRGATGAARRYMKKDIEGMLESSDESTMAELGIMMAQEFGIVSEKTADKLTQYKPLIDKYLAAQDINTSPVVGDGAGAVPPAAPATGGTMGAEA